LLLTKAISTLTACGPFASHPKYGCGRLQPPPATTH